MILSKLYDDRGTNVVWKVYAICQDSGECDLRTFLDDLTGDYRKYAVKTVAAMDDISKRGPEALTKFNSHQVDPLDKGVWQFTVGKIRVLFFYDDGKVIVCSHGFKKKTQKTPKSEQDAARRAKQIYLEDKKKNRLEIRE